MEIYKNKSSGKYFIYIEDTDINDRALFVSPEAKVLTIQFNLFVDDPEEGQEKDLLSEGLITQAQLESYRQYGSDRLKESNNRFEETWERHPPRPSRPERINPNDTPVKKEPDMIERMAKDFKHNKG